MAVVAKNMVSEANTSVLVQRCPILIEWLWARLNFVGLNYLRHKDNNDDAKSQTSSEICIKW